MALFRIQPTRADVEIAERISDHTGPEVEQISTILTSGADEHVVCALAAAWWLYCRRRSAQDRADSNHLLLTTAAVTLLPHLLKSIFDQKRPDRVMIRGHLHGVPFSGKPLDAFPFPATPSMSAR
jgi:undecaprenyl-diphosphatase